MNQKELNEHNEEIKALEELIKAVQVELSYKKNLGNFARLCNDAPIDGIEFTRNSAREMPYGAMDYKPVVRKHRREAWRALGDIVKQLFFIDDLTHIESSGESGHYAIKRQLLTGVSKNADLRLREQQIAVDFLNEAVALFNRYFKIANGELRIDGVRYILDLESGRYNREQEGID